MRPEDTRQERLEYLKTYRKKLESDDPRFLFDRLVREAIRKWLVADRTAKDYARSVLIAESIY